MAAVKITQQEKTATRLFFLCLFVAVAVWICIGVLYQASARENMWAPMAGILLGYILAGILSIIPAIAAANILLTTKERRPRARTILVLSLTWLGSVLLIYVIALGGTFV